MLNGRTLTRATLSAAGIAATDVSASNGIVHVINAVPDSVTQSSDSVCGLRSRTRWRSSLCAAWWSPGAPGCGKARRVVGYNVRGVLRSVGRKRHRIHDDVTTPPSAALFVILISRRQKWHHGRN